MKTCDFRQDQVTGIVKAARGPWLTGKDDGEGRSISEVHGSKTTCLPVPDPVPLAVLGDPRRAGTDLPRTGATVSVRHGTRLPGSPGGEGARRAEEGRVRVHSAAAAVISGRRRLPVWRPREPSQEALGCLHFPEWDHETTRIQTPELWERSRVPKSPSRPPPSRPGEDPTPSGRTARAQPLPALFFSGPRGRCPQPQAGTAASRHRASSSASLPPLLLSTSLTAPLGAAMLNQRKGLWERSNRVTAPRPHVRATKCVALWGL